MRILIAIAFVYALVIGVNQAASSGSSELGAQPATESTDPATDDAELDGPNNYECKYSPYCRKASQCTAYCAGGIAVCSNGCCACAS